MTSNTTSRNEEKSQHKPEPINDKNYDPEEDMEGGGFSGNRAYARETSAPRSGIAQGKQTKNDATNSSSTSNTTTKARRRALWLTFGLLMLVGLVATVSVVLVTKKNNSSAETDTSSSSSSSSGANEDPNQTIETVSPSLSPTLSPTSLTVILDDISSVNLFKKPTSDSNDALTGSDNVTLLPEATSVVVQDLAFVGRYALVGYNYAPDIANEGFMQIYDNLEEWALVGYLPIEPGILISIVVMSKTLAAVGGRISSSKAPILLIFSWYNGVWDLERRIAYDGPEIGSNAALSTVPVIAGVSQTSVFYTFPETESYTIDIFRLLQSGRPSNSSSITETYSFRELEGVQGYGASIGFSEGTLAVGAPVGAGAVYIYQQTRLLWLRKAILTASDANGDSDTGFGSSLALSLGPTIVVGAPQYGLSGVVYIFQEHGASDFAQAGKLTPSDNGRVYDFGSAVAISGDLIAVAAFSDIDKDAVYIFEKAYNDFEELVFWQQRGKILLPTKETGLPADKRHISLDMWGNILIVGYTTSPKGEPFVTAYEL